MWYDLERALAILSKTGCENSMCKLGEGPAENLDEKSPLQSS